MNQLSQIRTMMRKRRNGLTALFQSEAANSVAEVFKDTLLNNQHCQHIGAYLSVDNELSLTPLISLLSSYQKSCYLPILHPCHFRGLWFAPYIEEAPLTNNRYHIAEPIINLDTFIAPWELTMVLIPLTAFSRSGYRIGMGGGYYDYSFQFRLGTQSDGPLLIGCGYQCQQLQDEPLAQPWDIPLDAALTETGLHIFNPKKFPGYPT